MAEELAQSIVKADKIMQKKELQRKIVPLYKLFYRTEARESDEDEYVQVDYRTEYQFIDRYFEAMDDDLVMYAGLVFAHVASEGYCRVKDLVEGVVGIIASDRRNHRYERKCMDVKIIAMFEKND